MTKEQLLEQMPRLTDEAIKNVLRKWSVPEDRIEMFGISRERDIAQAQREADAEWMVEQELVRLPSEEEAQTEVDKILQDAHHMEMACLAGDMPGGKLLDFDVPKYIAVRLLRWLQEREKRKGGYYNGLPDDC